MQRPHTEHVVDLQLVLGQREHVDKQPAGNAAGGQRAGRMHDVGAGTNRDQPGQRPVVHKARIVAAHHQRDHDTAGHRHQRIDRDQA